MKSFVFYIILIIQINCLFGQQKQLFNVKIDKSADSKETLEEVQQLILDNYYTDEITKDDLNWAAIDGMLRHISPPESPELARLWTDKEYEKILNSLKGVKVTLGFKSSFNSNDGSLTVTSVTKGSEAEKKLAVYDRILRIDNQPLSGKSVSEVNKLLDGELNQTSTLKVIRDVSVFDVSLKRDSLKVENLIVTEIPNHHAALIELKKVTGGMTDDLDDELAALERKEINNIILDLRNNGGGVLNEGVNIARLFMKKNEVVLRTQSRSNGVSNYIAQKDQYFNFNIVVLINENTASAAEIISIALKDHDRAVLVGKKTFGKGVIETTYSMKNGYRAKFITNAMYSPKGISWQSKGILPDYFVDQTQINYNKALDMNISDRIRSDLHLSTALKLIKQE